MSSLLIRADASTAIGTGHAMRCLALAQAWQERGGTVTLAAAEFLPALAGRFAREGVGVEALAAPAGTEEDARETSARARRVAARCVVLDGYHFGPRFQAQVKEAGLPLLVVDDCGLDGPLAADWVLNQNIQARPDLYPNRPRPTRLLLGCEYALLRRDFRAWAGWRRDHPETATKVLITLGGSDPGNVTPALLRGLADEGLQGLNYRIAVGGGNPHRGAIDRAIRECGLRAEVLVDVKDMAALMAWADVAISAGGSTCWELAFLGLPALLLVLAENQRPAVELLDAGGAFQGFGAPSPDSLARLARALRELSADPRRRQRMSAAGRKLVDGQGARRVVEALGEGRP